MKYWIVLLILLIFTVITASPIYAFEEPSLIFSLDQSFGNGIIHQRDTVGLSKVISTLKIFQKYYPTYALLNPMNVDQNKVMTILDQLESNNIPFILDVYASDTLGIGAGNPSVAKPYDLSHGIPLSVSQLTNYKNRYNQFKGVRIFEVFGSDFTQRTCRTTNPEWCEPRWFSQTANPFFDANIAREFVRTAKENSLFVIWSDLHWYTFSQWDPIQQTYEQQMEQIISDYPNVVTPMYNNNIPDGQSQAHLNIWQTAVNKFSSSAGIGLSDQAWLHDQDHMNTPISELISWANTAIGQKAKFIEFEPVWYFFNFPLGIVWDPNNYTIDPRWINRGYPTDKLTALAKGLNITEPLLITYNIRDFYPLDPDKVYTYQYYNEPGKFEDLRQKPWPTDPTRFTIHHNYYNQGSTAPWCPRIDDSFAFDQDRLIYLQTLDFYNNTDTQYSLPGHVWGITSMEVNRPYEYTTQSKVSSMQTNNCSVISSTVQFQRTNKVIHQVNDQMSDWSPFTGGEQNPVPVVDLIETTYFDQDSQDQFIEHWYFYNSPQQQRYIPIRSTGFRKPINATQPTLLWDMRLSDVKNEDATIPGDLNTDGKVDIDDYNLLVAAFGHPYTIFDYNQLVANFGKSI